MKRSKELENILDSCLERVFAGETVEACIQDYPHYADELRELLETVTGVREAVDITPRPEFRQQAFREFQDAVRDLQPARSGGFFGFFGMHKWLATAVAAIAVIVMAGGGTVYAASGSLPDSLLYNVKLATESVRLAFSFSDESKTELYAQFANERVDEIVAMAEQGELDGVNKAADKLDEQLIAMADVNNGHAVLQSSAMSQDAAQIPDEGTFSASSQEAATVPAPAASPDTRTPDKVAPEPTDTQAGGTSEENGMLPAQDERHALTAEGPVAGGEKELKDSVVDDAVSNTIKLEEAKETAPEALQKAIDRAIEIALRGYGIAITNIESNFR